MHIHIDTRARIFTDTYCPSSKIPPIKGAVPIILAWFISPILTAACSATIYGLNVFFVLKSEHSTARSYYVLPLLVFVTVMSERLYTRALVTCVETVMLMRSPLWSHCMNAYH